MNPSSSIAGPTSIVTSGYSMGDDAQQSLRAGAKAFLPKPYTLEELSETVSAALAPVRNG